MALGHQLTANVLTVAVLASLVPSSYLIRRGDVRFRVGREMDAREVLGDAVRDRLRRMAMDIREADVEVRLPRMIAEDVRDLDRIPPMAVDVMVTSPPYLNGTNYFRNTKLELWFLRCLRAPADLARYRRLAVTAGINDVSAGKSDGQVVGSVDNLVDRMKATAYDPRIPQMVRAYFRDMMVGMSAVTRHLGPDLVLAIDIGDSYYGGVHVPTDELLVETLESLGCRLDHEVALRERMARSGQRARQVLLVFRRGGKPRPAVSQPGPTWESSWGRFKAELPHQVGDLNKRNWGHEWHRLCSYGGKMKPSLAASLIETFVKPGGRILDPFAGVGTIPFEAALRGRTGFAFSSARLLTTSPGPRLPTGHQRLPCPHR